MALLLLIGLTLLTPRPSPPSTAISLRRTICFGPCPVYSVTIAADGSVTYDGREHVRVGGVHRWKIRPAAVRALADELVKDGFFDLQDSYSSPWTDSPTVLTSLQIGDRSKTIRDYISGPPVLKQIERRIDTVSGAKPYIWIDGATIRKRARGGWRATDDAATGWFWDAARAGDADVLGALITAGADPSAVRSDGTTILMVAAESGDPDCVRLLITAGADPTFRDRSGRNAADRVRDAMNPPALPKGVPPYPPRVVDATGRPPEYALILQLLTSE